jgi:hypothetical protein
VVLFDLAFRICHRWHELIWSGYAKLQDFGLVLDSYKRRGLHWKFRLKFGFFTPGTR